MSQQMKIALTVIAAAGTGQLQKMAKVAEVIEKAQVDIATIGGVEAVVEQSTYTPRPPGLPRKPRAVTPTTTPNATPPASTPIKEAAKQPVQSNTEAAATPPAAPAWAAQAAPKKA